MLGKTAGGIFWMFRYIERSENTARLIETGFRISLTRSGRAREEWASILSAAGSYHQFTEKYDKTDAAKVIDFLLRDPDNPSSIMSVIEAARNNARLVRTALTRQVWIAMNDCWMVLKSALAAPVRETELPGLIDMIRQQNALVRGALHGTMLRNDIYNFARTGTFLERADSMARLLDVKYYVLLPSASSVGSSLDNAQWEIILRAASAERAFRWLNEHELSPMTITEFLVMDRRMPRSLAFCVDKIVNNLTHLEEDYGDRHDCHELAGALRQRLRETTIATLFDYGLHEFITGFIGQNYALGQAIEKDYRFYG